MKTFNNHHIIGQCNKHYANVHDVRNIFNTVLSQTSKNLFDTLLEQELKDFYTDGLIKNNKGNKQKTKYKNK